MFLLYRQIKNLNQEFHHFESIENYGHPKILATDFIYSMVFSQHAYFQFGKGINVLIFLCQVLLFKLTISLLNFIPTNIQINFTQQQHVLRCYKLTDIAHCQKPRDFTFVHRCSFSYAYFQCVVFLCKTAFIVFDEYHIWGVCLYVFAKY